VAKTSWQPLYAACLQPLVAVADAASFGACSTGTRGYIVAPASCLRHTITSLDRLTRTCRRFATHMPARRLPTASTHRPPPPHPHPHLYTSTFSTTAPRPLPYPRTAPFATAARAAAGRSAPSRLQRLCLCAGNAPGINAACACGRVYASRTASASSIPILRALPNMPASTAMGSLARV